MERVGVQREIEGEKFHFVGFFLGPWWCSGALGCSRGGARQSECFLGLPVLRVLGWGKTGCAVQENANANGTPLPETGASPAQTLIALSRQPPGQCTEPCLFGPSAYKTHKGCLTREVRTFPYPFLLISVSPTVTPPSQ